MKYEDAKDSCHVRSAIYRVGDSVKVFSLHDLNLMPSELRAISADLVGTIVPKRYWKNHEISLDDRIPEGDKCAVDWEEYDPRDDG